MELPVYITVEEVQRVCKALDIRDWTCLDKIEVSEDEAGMILANTDTAGLRIPLDDFRVGLEVELEHGTMYPAANVTNNHPLLTARIVRRAPARNHGLLQATGSGRTGGGSA